MSTITQIRTKKARPNRRSRGQNGSNKAVQVKVTQKSAPRKRRVRRPRKNGARLNGGGIVGVGNTRGKTSNKQSMIVTESEYIGEVSAANFPNFNVVQYPINPGQASTFPWLATIASRFEKYTFLSLSFEYKKEVSEFAPLGQQGKVMMSVDWDASDPAPATKQQIEDTDPHSDAMPSQTFRLNLKSRDLAHPTTIARYVRPGGLPGASDIKTYDVGNLNVATIGTQANGAVGELHVHYRVKLEKPVLESGLAPANNSVSSWVEANGQPILTGAVAQLAMSNNMSNGIPIVKTTLGVFTPPAGNYLVDWGIFYSSATTASVTSFAGSFLKNGTQIAPGVNYQGPANQALSLHQSTYVSANGTDTFVVNALATFTGGPLTTFGDIRWVAI